MPCTVYIHFPYCVTRCNYCDFNTYVTPNIPQLSYTNAIIQEGESRAPAWAHRELTSVFLGGGTPSLWEPTQIRRVLDAIADWFPHRSKDLEITMECNPMEATDSTLAEAIEAGVNRLSLGIQILNDTLLKQISRRHTAKEALEALSCTTSIGFKSVSADLMFGLPGQTPDDFKRDLVTLGESGVQHMSVYHLTLEPGTALTHAVQTQKVRLPNEGDQVQMWDLIQPTLGSLGFEQYEVSNYSFKGHRSRHNTSYWLGHPYLGLGAGAHSLHVPEQWLVPDASATRTMNYKNPRKYMNTAGDINAAVDMHENLDRETHLRERMFTGLRHLPGISLAAIHGEIGLDPREIYRTVIQDLVERMLVSFDGDQLKLTPNGLRFANEVFVQFF